VAASWKLFQHQALLHVVIEVHCEVKQAVCAVNAAASRLGARSRQGALLSAACNDSGTAGLEAAGGPACARAQAAGHCFRLSAICRKVERMCWRLPMVM
jgi:hypothetical protein